MHEDKSGWPNRRSTRSTKADAAGCTWRYSQPSAGTNSLHTSIGSHRLYPGKLDSNISTRFPLTLQIKEKRISKEPEIPLRCISHAVIHLCILYLFHWICSAYALPCIYVAALLVLTYLFNSVFRLIQSISRKSCPKKG